MSALAPADSATALTADLAAVVARLDRQSVELDFWRQDELLVVPAFVPEAIIGRISEQVTAAQRRLVRKTVPRYKASASMSRFTLDELAPAAVALYRSPVLQDLLSSLCDMPLQVCPDADPHACAVYHYDRPGDRIGWHYDSSWYRGARYTALIGLVDESCARLHCRLHSRDRHRPTRELMVATTPGTLVFFNGDKLLHEVTALRADERRTVLSLQYVSDPRIAGWRLAISKAKDSLAYFGIEGLARPRRQPKDIAPRQELICHAR